MCTQQCFPDSDPTFETTLDQRSGTKPMWIKNENYLIRQQHKIALSLTHKETQTVQRSDPVLDPTNQKIVQDPTLLKKKRKFSSYIRKFRRDRGESHIWLPASSYMQPIPSELPYTVYEEHFLFFLSVVPDPDRNTQRTKIAEGKCARNQENISIPIYVLETEGGRAERGRGGGNKEKCTFPPPDWGAKR